LQDPLQDVCGGGERLAFSGVERAEVGGQRRDAPAPAFMQQARAGVRPMAMSWRRRRRSRWMAAECRRSATERLTEDICIC